MRAMAYDFQCAAVTVSNHVAEVALAVSGKGHKMGPSYWYELPALFNALDADESVRAVLIHTPAEHFTYGLDLQAMGAELGEHTAPDSNAAQRTKFLALVKQLQGTHDAVAKCRKPVIAAVSGWCIGGGVDLITAADIRLASSTAKFSVREVRIAIVPDVGTLARLPGIVGQGAARELSLTGDDFDAARALQIGLVTHVFDSQEQLMIEARAMAMRLAKNSPLAVQGIKQVMNLTSEREAKLSLDFVALWNTAFFPSEDVQEAIGAFIEKRDPVFKGR